jgi:isoleucyl-tRNA synthetase
MYAYLYKCIYGFDTCPNVLPHLAEDVWQNLPYATGHKSVFQVYTYVYTYIYTHTIIIRHLTRAHTHRKLIPEYTHIHTCTHIYVYDFDTCRNVMPHLAEDVWQNLPYFTGHKSVFQVCSKYMHTYTYV